MDAFIRWLQIIALAIFTSIALILFIQIRFQINFNLGELDICLTKTLEKYDLEYEEIIGKYKSGLIDSGTLKGEISDMYEGERLEIVSCMTSTGRIGEIFSGDY